MPYVTTHLQHPYIDEEALAREYSHVFHYTTATALQSILKSGGLWATHYKRLNDATEFRFASTEIAADSYKRSRGKLRTALELRPKLKKVALEKYGTIRNMLEKEAAILPNAMLNLADEYMPMHILSFATHLRKHQLSGGLLSLWRAYAAGAGVAMRFKTDVLLDVMKKIRAAQTYHALYLSVVTYGDEDARFLEKRAGLEGMSGIYQRLTKALIRGEKLEKMPPEFDDIASRFLVTSITHKHPAFEDEREIRLVASPLLKLEPEDERSDPCWVDRGLGNSRLSVECLEALDGILIGPDVAQSKTAELIAQTLKALGLDRVEIELSDIPYRRTQSQQDASA